MKVIFLLQFNSKFRVSEDLEFHSLFHGVPSFSTLRILGKARMK